jgi:hypothetical protein
MMQRLISGLILLADVISGFIATPGLNTPLPAALGDRQF